MEVAIGQKVEEETHGRHDVGDAHGSVCGPL